MHPNSTFTWTDHAAMHAFVNKRGFAHIFLATAGDVHVAHAPVLVTEQGNLRFHFARANALGKATEPGLALASISDVDFYVSPDWYELQDQVPTWNYRAVEVRGSIRRMNEDELITLLDDLSALHEANLPPKPVWTRSKMRPGVLETALKGIIGYELIAESWQGTQKFAQNKRMASRESVASALEALGRNDAAAAMTAMMQS
jgi:transcriptional regulator